MIKLVKQKQTGGYMDERLLKIQKLLDSAEGNLASARNILRDFIGNKPSSLYVDNKVQEADSNDEENIIEGIFKGEVMVGSDGKTYPVSANYASKSKLVEGDGLKLTIAVDGSFIYKQIRPVDRKNVIGTLSLDGSSYRVLAEGRSYKILTASVTFYKAKPGDSVTVTIPKNYEAEWAAMENVLTKNSQPEECASNDNDQNIVGDDLQFTTDEKVTSADNGLLANTTDNQIKVTSQKTIEETSEIVKKVGQHQPSEIIDNNATEASDTDIYTPKIEFPGGQEELSDDQLLEKLKSNLQNTQPKTANISVDTISPSSKSTDNGLENDLSNAHSAEANSNSDQPISELEI